MRRPSRQGLIRVCRHHAATLIQAIQYLSGREALPCLRPARIIQAFMRLGLSCLLVTGLLVVLPMSLRGQNVRAVVEDFFSKTRGGQHTRLSDSLLSSAHAQNVFDVARAFVKDSSVSVRMESLELIDRCSRILGETKIRKRAAEILAVALEDPSPEVMGLALTFLRHYHKGEFPPTTRPALQRLIRSEVTHLADVLRLAGYLEQKELIPDIRLFSQAGHPPTLRWASLLSLARLGDASAIRDIMNRVRRLPVNDDVVYRIFPDLVYTRHPEAIDYLVAALHADEKSCISADVEKETSIPCGYRIMEQLAPVIEGFPVRLNASGDLETEDYPAALGVVRQWFNANKDYTIILETY